LIITAIRMGGGDFFVRRGARRFCVFLGKAGRSRDASL
jgi:hypothetical protein